MHIIIHPQQLNQSNKLNHHKSPHTYSHPSKQPAFYTHTNHIHNITKINNKNINTLHYNQHFQFK